MGAFDPFRVRDDRFREVIVEKRGIDLRVLLECHYVEEARNLPSPYMFPSF